jgi:putative DNA primase/helicase
MTLQPPSFETIRAALDCIPPDVGHDERVRLAFAVFDGIGDGGAELWQAWAARRAKPNAAEDRATWKSARKRGPVTVATLFGIARDHGYRSDPVQTAAQAPTPAELKAQTAARQAAAERERQAQAERHRAAAAEAARQWAQASESGASAYLTRKGVANHGGRFGPGGVFLVPARDAAGELWNLQTIKPERPSDDAPEKLFMRGARKTGTLHMIGNAEAAPWLLVAEGYATAASVHEATGRPVAVAWDAGNLGHVVRALRGRYPAARVAVCGDDDTGTEARTGTNPGRLKATEAARVAKGPEIFPEGLAPGASDFNDLHQSAGLDEVRRIVETALQAAEAAEAAPNAAGTKKTAPAGRERAARGGGDEGGSGASGFDLFRVDGDGLWFDPPEDGSGGAGRPLRVCGPLHVVALARDAHDNGAALLLQFDTPFRAGREWLMPLAMLAGDGTAYRAELWGLGFATPTDTKRRALLTMYLASRKPAELVRIVDRVGWHGRAYVLPRETLGDDGGERIRFQSEAPTEGTFSMRGNAELWRERIGRLCLGNSRLAFGVSLALAGPLLAWAAGTDGGGFHLVGDSSCGKTTALRVAASVWGGRDYLQRWRATDNGLEGLAAQHSDGLLCLDELAQLDARVAGESAYMLANGQGKSRAGRSGAARPRLTWRLLFFSAGEIGLAEHMAEAKKSTRAGQELRMIDIPADAGAGRGIFEELHEHESGGTLAQHLTRATEATFGAVGRAWLEHLCGHTDGLSKLLRERIDRTAAELVPEAAAGQVQRVGRRFALVAVAGELATEAGLTGWHVGAASWAVRQCLNAWIAARPGGIGLSEDAQMLRRARLWFAAHGLSARLPDFDRRDDDHAPQAINQAGYRRKVKTESGMVETWHEWFIFPDVFRVELCNGGDVRPMLRLLDSLGHLHKEKPQGFTCGLPIGGKARPRVYWIKPSILNDAED